MDEDDSTSLSSLHADKKTAVKKVDSGSSTTASTTASATSTTPAPAHFTGSGRNCFYVSFYSIFIILMLCWEGGGYFPEELLGKNKSSNESVKANGENLKVVWIEFSALS